MGGCVGAAVGVGVDELGTDLGPFGSVDGAAEGVQVLEGGFFRGAGLRVGDGLGAGWGGERHGEQDFVGWGPNTFCPRRGAKDGNGNGFRPRRATEKGGGTAGVSGR